MKEYLLDKENTYIIGVSGGCDSMYLLDTLYSLGYQLVVCHVNYHYRHDSDEDTALVKKYCHLKGIDCFVKECQTQDYQEGNFQSAAREIRYQFYKEIANQYHTDYVLTAHHKDDYLENVLMQLEKHKTYFYLGIQEISHIHELNVVRVLLDTYKEDIRNRCIQNKIPYRDDYTNFETQFKRDQIRNTVLNRYTLEEKEALYTKAVKHNQRIDEKKKKLQPYLTQYKKQGYIDIHSINDEDIYLFIYLLLYEEVNADITYSLVEEVIKQMTSDKPNIEANLPVNKVFIKEYNNIYVSDKDDTKAYTYTLDSIEYIETPYFIITDNGYINTGVDIFEDEWPITIRNAKHGDVIKTSGGTKKISRLFIDQKIPKSKRVRYPVILNKQGEIILIPNIAKNYKHLSTNASLFVII